MSKVSKESSANKARFNPLHFIGMNDAHIETRIIESDGALPEIIRQNRTKTIKARNVVLNLKNTIGYLVKGTLIIKGNLTMNLNNSVGIYVLPGGTLIYEGEPMKINGESGCMVGIKKSHGANVNDNIPMTTKTKAGFALGFESPISLSFFPDSMKNGSFDSVNVKLNGNIPRGCSRNIPSD